MKDKRITITGGRGFLGKHLVRAFEARGCNHILVADLPEYNLIRPEDIRRLYDEQRPDIVVHLAAKVGGIGFNQENPGALFYENIMMGVPLLHEGCLRKIEKFVALGTICAYPKFTPVPFREDDLWNGYPEETNAPYGLAKKMMLVQAQAYRQQYGFNAIFLLPVNLYGPGDNFDPRSSHVIPALIKKCVDAVKRGRRGNRRLGDGHRDAGVLLRGGRGRGDRSGDGTVRQTRAGQHRRRVRDLHPGVGRPHRRADGLYGTRRLGRVETRRPAAADARYDARLPRIRFPRADRLPGRPCKHARLVSKSTINDITYEPLPTEKIDPRRRRAAQLHEDRPTDKGHRV